MGIARMNHTNATTLAEDLLAQENGDASLNIHGEYSLSQIIVLVNEISEYLNAIGDRRLVIAAAPTGDTDKICLANPDLGKFCVRKEDKISLYLHQEEDFLIKSYEEYRKILEYSEDVKIIYRSWRDIEGHTNNWEFNNYIFIFKDR
jgi:hypothetical protein